MKQEIYQDGKLKMTLISTDGSACDIVTMPKVLVKECSMSSTGFDELFFSFLKENVTHTQAYEQAEQVQRRRYSSYESFKSVRYRDHKK
jgi:hypothetical protein